MGDSAVVQAHAASQFKSIQHRLRIGHVFADNVIGRSVGRCGDGNGQSAMHGDALFKTHELHGYLALVVVHSDNTVIAAVLPNGANKGGVGREGTLSRQACGSCHFNAWCNDSDFLISVIAVVPVVRIESADSQAG